MPRDLNWWPRFLTPTNWKTQAVPATPAAGDVVTYAKSDKRMYGKDDAGVEFMLGIPSPLFEGSNSADVASGGSGAEVVVTGCSSGNVAVGAKGVKVTWSGGVYNGSNAGRSDLRLYQDGALADTASATSAALNQLTTASKVRTFHPSVGNHTYELRIFGSGASNGHALGSATVPTILIVEAL